MKRHAPATARNSEPLAQVLAKELPDSGLVLEIASGSGEHAVFMARRFPSLLFQPSDRDPEALLSINGWADEAGLHNLLPGITLDAFASDWPVDEADAILCVNMVHIAPWQATEGLFRGAAKRLGEGAPLILYGPYFEDAVDTANSNVAFDQGLRSRNPAWGLRRLSRMDLLASQTGLERTARYEMPANNLTLIYRRTSA